MAPRNSQDFDTLRHAPRAVKKPFSNTCPIVVFKCSDPLLHGKGAGRWPASLSVMAGLLDLHKSNIRCRYDTNPTTPTAEVPG